VGSTVLNLVVELIAEHPEECGWDLSNISSSS